MWKHKTIRNGVVHNPYEIKCINCNLYFKKEDIFGSGEETTPTPITKADRIRSMTDEELADFLDETDPVYWDRQTWLDWLKQEVSTDG